MAGENKEDSQKTSFLVTFCEGDVGELDHDWNGGRKARKRQTEGNVPGRSGKACGGAAKGNLRAARHRKEWRSMIADVLEDVAHR